MKKIPYGKIVTYGMLASALKKPRSARAVGNALSKNPYHSVPCHRVVRSDGLVGGYVKGEKEKIERLCSEGILVGGRTVNLSIYRWKKKLFLK